MIIKVSDWNADWTAQVAAGEYTVGIVRPYSPRYSSLDNWDVRFAAPVHNGNIRDIRLTSTGFYEVEFESGYTTLIGGDQELYTLDRQFREEMQVAFDKISEGMSRFAKALLYQSQPLALRPRRSRPVRLKFYATGARCNQYGVIEVKTDEMSLSWRCE